MSQFEGLFKNPEEVKPVRKPQAAKKTKSVPVPVATSNIRKRPLGKSADPRFTQVLTYVKKETHNQVKAALIFDQQGRDLSDLVEELLAGWLAKNQHS